MDRDGFALSLLIAGTLFVTIGVGLRCDAEVALIVLGVMVVGLGLLAALGGSENNPPSG